jgi:hypothetical protein
MQWKLHGRGSGTSTALLQKDLRLCLHAVEVLDAFWLRWSESCKFSRL